jgi:hypothetical protein
MANCSLELTKEILDNYLKPELDLFALTATLFKASSVNQNRRRQMSAQLWQALRFISGVKSN